MSRKIKLFPCLRVTLLLAAAFLLGRAAAQVTSSVAASHSGQIQSSAEGNWGLGFQEEGQPPVGNATSQELAQYDAFYLGDTDKKRIYLTFDAGYENGNTEPILDALKKHEAPAAFFVVGNFISENPDLIRRMEEEGHIVGNHTSTHPDMSRIATLEAFREELEGVEASYKEITGKEMTRFYKLLGRIHPGAIVLLHSTSSTNGEIMDELLEKWEDMGYSFGSLEELAQRREAG